MQVSAQSIAEAMEKNINTFLKNSPPVIKDKVSCCLAVYLNGKISHHYPGMKQGEDQKMVIFNQATRAIQHALKKTDIDSTLCQNSFVVRLPSGDSISFSGISVRIGGGCLAKALFDLYFLHKEDIEAIFTAEQLKVFHSLRPVLT